MKNLNVISVLLLISILSIYSCDKSKEEFLSKTENNKLETINNLYNRTNINFNLDFTISLSSEICNALNVNFINILPGDYTIDFTDNYFGRITMDITSSSSVSLANSELPGIRIYLAKKKPGRKCRVSCDCGWGFRCGPFEILSVIDATLDAEDNELRGDFHFSPDGTKLTLNITEYIDHEALFDMND